MSIGDEMGKALLDALKTSDTETIHALALLMRRVRENTAMYHAIMVDPVRGTLIGAIEKAVLAHPPVPPAG